VFTWDLGIFNQAFWNTLHGRLLYYTAEPFYTKTGCFLASHFSPLLLAIVPLYAICPRPENLLIISTFVIAIGALPAYEIAKFLLKNEKAAVILGIFYLIYPPLQGVTLCGFSLESFIVTLSLFIVYYLIKVDLKKLALAVSLGLMTHEAAAPVIMFIALYGMAHFKSVKNKGFQASLIILAVSIPYFFFAQNMRYFFGWTGSPSLWNEWSILGAQSPAEVPFKIITNPEGAWLSLMYDGTAKLNYLVILLLPAMFLPLLGLKGLIPAIPYLVISLFSSYPVYYILEGHYAAFVSPFIFLGMLHGVIKLRKWIHLDVSVSKIAKVIIFTCLISLALVSLSTYSKFVTFSTANEHNDVIRRFISRIPKNASVLTTSNIFPHVSDRHDAYTIPSPMWAEQYMNAGRQILLNLSRAEVKYVLLDFRSDPYYSSAAELIYTDFILRNRHKYKLLGNEDGVMLYKSIMN